MFNKAFKEEVNCIKREELNRAARHRKHLDKMPIDLLSCGIWSTLILESSITSNGIFIGTTRAQPLESRLLSY